jgi:hypothetical protein
MIDIRKELEQNKSHRAELLLHYGIGQNLDYATAVLAIKQLYSLFALLLPVRSRVQLRDHITLDQHSKLLDALEKFLKNDRAEDLITEFLAQAVYGDNGDIIALYDRWLINGIDKSKVRNQLEDTYGIDEIRRSLEEVRAKLRSSSNPVTISMPIQKSEIHVPAAAILPENRASYLQTVARLIRFIPLMSLSMAQRIGLWIVHLKEYRKLKNMTPEEFDAAHGSTNVERRNAIDRMQNAGKKEGMKAIWAGAWLSLGILIGFHSLSGIAFAALTILSFVAVIRPLARFIASGIAHVQYDLTATLPLALVASNSTDESETVAAALEKGLVPALLRPMWQGEQEGAGYERTGTKGVWTKVEKVGANRVTILYIEAVTIPDFKQKAAEFISSLKGYGNVEGSAQSLRVLETMTGAKLNAHELMVINAIGLEFSQWQDILVKTSVKNLAEYPIEKNVHDAQRYATTSEVGFFLTRWSNAFKNIPRFNRSLVFTVKALQEAVAANPDNIRILQSKGAKVHVMYDGKNKEEAQKIIDQYGLNGIIYTNSTVEVSEMVHGNNNLVVAGLKVSETTPQASNYTILDLGQENFAALKQTIENIPAGSVVHVKLGTSELNEERRLLLRKLSPTNFVIFDGDHFREESMERDMTQIMLSGVNALELLIHLTQKLQEDKAPVLRKEAYALEFGIFEKYDDADQLKEDTNRVFSGIADANNLTGFARNQNFFKAIRHRAIDLSDKDRKIYLTAVIERLQERVERAQVGKLGDFEDKTTEMKLGELIQKANEQGQRVPAEPAVMAKFKTLEVTPNNSDQFQLDLYNELKTQEGVANGDDATKRPKALSTMIELIKLYAGETIHVEYDGANNTPMSADATKAILEAA